MISTYMRESKNGYMKNGWSFSIKCNFWMLASFLCAALCFVCCVLCARTILIHQNVICTHLSDKRGQFDYTYSFRFVICCEHSQIIDYFAVKSKRLLHLFYPCIFRNVLLLLLMSMLLCCAVPALGL